MIDDPTDLFEHTLDDYLVGLANGIRQAQAQLNAIVVDGPPGQPAVGYQLPRVDFELKLSFALASTANSGGSAAPRLLARAPQPGGVGGNGFTAEGTSTLRGSFVAVPLAAQRPPVLLTIGFKVRRETEVELVATVADALGVAQVGVEVEFNIDRERSATLGGADAVPLDEATHITPAVVATDAEGRAVAVLHISERESAGALIAVSVDALGVTETALMQAPDPVR
jgi:hypothetical protein